MTVGCSLGESGGVIVCVRACMCLQDPGPLQQHSCRHQLLSDNSHHHCFTQLSVSNLIKLCTLNVCISLHATYTSINLGGDPIAS